MMRCRSRDVSVLVAAVLWCAAAAGAGPDILPFEDIRPGMTGVGRTVFAGNEIVEFDVEIVGTLPGIAPDQDLILGLCTGGPLTDTRILSGMSGSPVFVDGKLIGAVAYSWGFSTAPIAGITPIGEIMAIPTRGTARSPVVRSAGPLRSRDLDILREAAGIDRFFRDRLVALAGPAGSVTQPAVPLAVAGLSPTGLSAIAGDLALGGFLPTQAGSSGTGTGPDKLSPGSPVGVKLVRGDVEMTATGTVTWVDGDDVLAFGHPLFGLGEVDLPMTAARVETLLPSLLQSSRIATPTAEVGVLVQDRPSGIHGRLGATASMIPVRVQYTDADGSIRTYAFDVAEDPLLAPVLTYYALNGIVASRDRAFGSVTVRVGEGSVIKLQDFDDVALDNLFSGPMAVPYATGTPAYILHLLLNNDWDRPRVAGINLMLEYDARPRTARIQRVTLDRYRIRPGETARATVVLQPYQGREIVLDREFTVPAALPAGPLHLDIGGSLAVSRPQAGQEPLMPRDLAQFVRLINHLRRNDNIYLVASRDDDGVFLGGARLPNLPPSITGVLTRPRNRGNVTTVSRRGVLEEEIPTQFAVEGIARIQLVVETP